jgi:hypothetical protein
MSLNFQGLEVSMGKLQTCTKCGSIYDITFTRITVRDQDAINCEVCGELLHRWSEAKIWEAKLVEKHEQHLKGNSL